MLTSQMLASLAHALDTIDNTCDDCEEPAAYTCSHQCCKARMCGRPMLLCRTCADEHKKRKSTQSHDVVAIRAEV